MFIVVNQVLRK